jgi:hypothetical protein
MWKNGTWKVGTWLTGLWAGEEVPVTVTGGGKAKRKPRTARPGYGLMPDKPRRDTDDDLLMCIMLQ